MRTFAGWFFAAFGIYCFVGIVFPRFAPLRMKTGESASWKIRAVFGYMFGCVGAACLVSGEEPRTLLCFAASFGFIAVFFGK